MIYTSKLESNFAYASSRYDKEAAFQRTATDELETFIQSNHPGHPVNSCLELGCGTGFLTERLLKLFPSIPLFATDISHSMLGVCKKKFADAHAAGCLTLERCNFNNPFHFSVSPFQLAVSGMALQWAHNPTRTLLYLRKVLPPDGWTCYFSIPLEGTFRILHELFRAENLPFPGLNLPDEPELSAALEALEASNVKMEYRHYEEDFDSLSKLLHSLRNTGTVNASSQVVPLAPMRRILRRHKGKATANYEYVLIKCSK